MTATTLTRIPTPALTEAARRLSAVGYSVLQANRSADTRAANPCLAKWSDLSDELWRRAKVVKARAATVQRIPTDKLDEACNRLARTLRALRTWGFRDDRVASKLDTLRRILDARHTDNRTTVGKLIMARVGHYTALAAQSAPVSP